MGGAESETVTGAMLIEKRAHFEDKLNVPENKRLQSGGWVQKFLRTYNLKEIHELHDELRCSQVQGIVYCNRILNEVQSGRLSGAAAGEG